MLFSHPIVRGYLDGVCVYLEASERQPIPGELVATFASYSAAWPAVQAAREASVRLAEIFGAKTEGA